MATAVNLPELGENIESGTVIAVLVNVGDRVEKDQPLVELETDKAVVEVPSSEGGVIQEIRVKEGDTLPVGGTILILNPNGSAAGTVTVEPPQSPEPEAPPPEPEEPAAVEAPPEPEAVPETPAAVETPPSPETKSKMSAAVETPPSHEAAPETPAATVAEETPEAESPPQPEPAAPTADTTAEPPRARGTVRAAPSVRRLAREIGVELEAVQPATPGGLIRAEDVKAHARKVRSEPGPAMPPAPGAAPAAAKLPNFEKWGPVRREKMSTVRRLTAENMARSWTAPHVTQNDKADITELEKFRKEYGKRAEAAGGKLTATAILVKVLAKALQRFPQFNCSVDMANSELIYKDYYNIGVAVDTPHGLMVPSIKNVNEKSLIDIARELTGISARARERKSTLDELQGSCITITNLGGIGGTAFTPIVNTPEVAILGVSRGSIEPVWTDGEFVPRMRLPISLSYDHRVIDGADAARFTRWICEALEQPMLLFLES